MSTAVTSSNSPSKTSTPTQVEDLRVTGVKRLITPVEVKELHKASPETLNAILEARNTARRILRGEDPRLMVVVGPCSIHDTESAMDYARRLKALADELQDRLFIVMRVYFEKPRTTVGWKGLINDPHLDDSGDVEYGNRVFGSDHSPIHRGPHQLGCDRGEDNRIPDPPRDVQRTVHAGRIQERDGWEHPNRVRRDALGVFASPFSGN